MIQCHGYSTRWHMSEPMSIRKFLSRHSIIKDKSKGGHINGPPWSLPLVDPWALALTLEIKAIGKGTCMSFSHGGARQEKLVIQGVSLALDELCFCLALKSRNLSIWKQYGRNLVKYLTKWTPFIPGRIAMNAAVWDRIYYHLAYLLNYFTGTNSSVLRSTGLPKTGQEVCLPPRCLDSDSPAVITDLPLPGYCLGKAKPRIKKDCFCEGLRQLAGNISYTAIVRFSCKAETLSTRDNWNAGSTMKERYVFSWITFLINLWLLLSWPLP